MNKRVVAVVSLFGGVIAMIAVWLVLTSSSATNQVRPKQPMIKDRKMVKMNPQMRKVDVTRIRDNPAMRPIPVDGVARPPARPLTAPPGAAGVYPLDQDGIAAAVAEQRPELEACYETALFHTPGLSGSMTLELEIVPVEGEPWATIETVGIESDLDATVLEGCLTTVFEDLKFAADEITTVKYPLVLDTDDDEAPADAAPPVEAAP